MSDDNSLDDVSPIDELERRREASKSGGGKKRIERQHEKGKLTAYERIDILLDDGTFVEIDPFVENRAQEFGMDEKEFPGDAIVTGYGEVNGRKVFVFAHDFTVLGGSVGEAVGNKIEKVMEQATKTGVPVIGLNDSGGARIQEGGDSLVGFAKLFKKNTDASGLIPQISAIMGPCAGGATYSPALTDFTFMVEETSNMMITGPDVIETVTGEEVTKEELGGAKTHASKSGVAHFTYETEEEVLQNIRRLLTYLPQNNLEKSPEYPSDDSPDRRLDNISDIVPSDEKKPYDVREVLTQVVDSETFFEVQSQYAQNVVIGFGLLDGKSVGIVANQPRVNAGTLDIDASQKAARFVRFCDSFNIPILTFVDVPGFMPGVDQEHNGIIKHGAKLIYAYSEATTPLLTVNLRKAYGGAYIVMASKYLGADMNYAWPDSEMAVMGPKGAVNILYRDEIANANNTEEKREQLIEKYRNKFANPYEPAKRGYIDDVIKPKKTRRRLINDLDLLISKREETPPKDHGNVPL